MLQVAIPNKGALSEEAVQLLKEAGYRCRRFSRELVVIDREHEVEFIFLRPRDIATYVGNGTIDLGITGRDLLVDSGAVAEELMALNFGRSRFCFAGPKGQFQAPADFAGLRIATSFPTIVEQFLKEAGILATVVKLDGAVEISIQLGVADIIADVVETGRTLIEAGLELVGDPIMESEAILLSRSADIVGQDQVTTLMSRLRGCVVAREYVLIDYDIPEANLEAACKITPGIESPTVSTLADPSMRAVRAMAKAKGIHKVMDDLKKLDARAILVTDLTTCRL